MVDKRLMGLSLLCVLSGVLLILYPKFVVSASRVLDRSVNAIDGLVLRYRYVVGITLTVAGYAVFQIALLLAR